MHRLIALIIGISLAALAPSALAAKKAEVKAGCKEPGKIELKPGMKVISHLAGPNWTVGKVAAVKGRKVEVEDAKGGLGSVSISDVVPHPSALYHDRTPPCFMPGDRVLARSTGGTWREATVTDANQGRVALTFLDKRTANAGPLDLVRMPK